MIERVISGFQAGADIAGIEAARRFQIPTGGWMPKGCRTEDGPRPEYLERYGAREMPSGAYPERTRMNASEADGTLFFGESGSGYGATFWACAESRKPFLWIRDPDPEAAIVAVRWIEENGINVLNVAGNRASKNPYIGAKVRAYLAAVFRQLGHQEA